MFKIYVASAIVSSVHLDLAMTYTTLGLAGLGGTYNLVLDVQSMYIVHMYLLCTIGR
jgi:hypothetical protein